MTQTTERPDVSVVVGELYLLEMDDVDGTWWGWCGSDGSVLSGGHRGAPDFVNRRLCLREALRAVESVHGAVLVSALCGLRVRNSACRRPQEFGVLRALRTRDGGFARGKLEQSSFVIAGELTEGVGFVLAREAAWEALVGAGVSAITEEDGDVVRVGTDASVDPVAGVGVWCWYAEDGRYGLGVVEAVNSSSLVETQAVAEALVGGKKVHVITDCKHFLKVLTSERGAKRGRCSEAEKALRQICVERLAHSGSKVTWKKGHRGRGPQVSADHLSRGYLRAVVASRGL